MPSHRAWTERLRTALARRGAAGRAAARYLTAHGIELRLRDQPTAARWTLRRTIDIHPRYSLRSPAEPYALSLVVHEIEHIRQGFFAALSVYGELRAWKAQFGFLLATGAKIAGSRHQRQLIRSLLGLPSGWDRPGLQKSRDLMRAYAGKSYRVDLLPLYPLPQELSFWMFRRAPR